MTYIFLVAGKGTRLHPLTFKHPKSLYKLDDRTTVLKRMVDKILKFDEQAEIVIVTGFKSEVIRAQFDDNEGLKFINNPFYAITNSIASLWFARNYLNRDNIAILNGDIVMDEELIESVLCKAVEKPVVLLDSSIKVNGDYNVQVESDKVLVMSKELDEYYGEYAGVTKLDKISAQKLYSKISEMIMDQMYDQWYENALVQMIFEDNFELYYKDICEYKWTEVDCVGDMLLAKKIHLEKDKNN